MSKNIIAVDDEQFALLDLEAIIKEVEPDNNINCFNSPISALEYAKQNLVDIAFLDIEMGSINGIVLAKQLKEINPKTNIIFITGYSHYALDAHSVYSTGYLMKPVTVDLIREALNNLRHPIKTKEEKRLKVTTFGNFEIFLDNKPLRFSRSKTKELFAYIISKQGAFCSNNEIISVIWETKEDTPALQSYYQNLISDLTKTFNDAGLNDILIKQRGYIAVCTEKITCDLYDFCSGININKYMGEFMKQYSWAEFTNAYLNKITR